MMVRIRTRLLAGFVALVLLMTGLALYSLSLSGRSLEKSVGQNSMFLAEEMLKAINRDIYHRIEALQVHTSHFLFQKILTESNEAFSRMPNVNGWIDRREKEWSIGPEGDLSPLMESVIHNDLSESLRREIVSFYDRRYGYRVFGEIFVTNRYGAVIAATGRTLDYRQDDEIWWQDSRSRGFFVGPVEYDESSGVYAISVGIRVMDAEGRFAGVMKAVVDTKGIVREAEVAAKRYDTTQVRVITSEGRLIYSSRAFHFLEDLSKRPFFENIKSGSGFFLAEWGDKTKLYAYGKSQGYRGFRGLNWILVLSHDVREVLAPVISLRNQILAASAGIIGIAVVIAFFMSGAITRPVTKLMQGAQEIRHGNLNFRISGAGSVELRELADAFNEMAAERLKTEQTLAESESRFRSFFEAGAIGMVMGDPEGRFIQVNEAFCRILGYEEKELLGRPFQSLVYPEDLKEELGDLIRLMKGEIPHYHREERLIHRNGSHVWVKVSVSLVRDADGMPVALTAGITDITERKKAEERIQAQIETIRQNEMELERHRRYLERTVEERTAELVRSNQELEQFAYVASHDLKEPLRKIANFTGLLKKRYKGKLDEKADQYIHYVVDGAARMDGLINDLLAYSRVGRAELPSDSIPMETVFGQTLEDLQIVLVETGAAVTHDSLPEVKANPQQLGQLLQNLISNAVKFKREEAPLIHLSAVRQDNEWRFSLQDNGIGFDPEQKERIFQIFQRLHTRIEYPGTGIGLAVCRKIVERHGGRIWADSEPGKGSTFYFTLPA